MRDVKTNGLVFDLENLRSGLDYDAEITITDRFGVTSAIKAVSFKTTGNLSPNDSAIHAAPGFGKALATLTTQVYISLYHEKLTNPYAEQYNITVRDVQGNPVSWTAQEASIGTMDKGLLLNGLSLFFCGVIPGKVKCVTIKSMISQEDKSGKNCFHCRRCSIYGADMTTCDDSESCSCVVCEIYGLVLTAKASCCGHYEARETSDIIGGLICR